MTKAKQQPAAPAKVTAAQHLEVAIHAAVSAQRQDYRKLASMMEHLADNLTRKAEYIRRHVDLGTLDQPLVMRAGEIQGQGPEIDLLCRQVAGQAEDLKVLQSVYNKLTAEQDAARMALAVVGEVAAAEIDKYAGMSAYDRHLEEARAELTVSEIEDALERRAAAEAKEYYGG